MQVIEATTFGAPQVLVPQQVADPVAGATQVVIDVSAAEVLFLDTQLRGGWGRDYFPLQPPYVPGTGVAGQVSAVGEGVDPEWLGRWVVASTSSAGEYRGGAYAQRVAVPVSGTVPIPEGLDAGAATAALHDGPMALSRLDRAVVQHGDWVLVTAAAGALGTWLIPLARRAGARVIGAARGPRKLDLARQLGAEAVLDYSQPGWQWRAQELTGGAGVDVVFDGAGSDIGRSAFGITAPGGRFFSYGAAGGDFAWIDHERAQRQGISVTGIDDVIAPADYRRLIRQSLDELATGSVRPVIGQAVSLTRAAEAHAAIEARTVLGKTLLLPGQ